MLCLLQICLILAFVYWIDITNGTPLFQGFKVQKGIEVQLTPFNFKPLTLFTEKWSPFGRFGIRKGIQKRDLGDVEGNPPPHPPVAPAPVFETVEEHKDIIDPSLSKQLSAGPNPVNVAFSNPIRIPVTESYRPPTAGLYTTIDRVPLVNNNLVERPEVLNVMYGELPPRPVGPIPAQPGLETVVPLMTPRPPVTVMPNVPFSEVPPTEGPFVRGSRLALYFGNVLVQLVSQFLANARLQFQQFSTPISPQPAPVPVSTST